MSKIILTDVDGVLLHISSKLEQFLREKLDLKHETPFEDVFNSGKDVLCEWLETHEEHAHELFSEFNKSEHFGEMEPYGHAVDVVRKLADDGWRFVAITTCGSDSDTYKLRKDNLMRNFGDVFEDIHCIDYNPRFSHNNHDEPSEKEELLNHYGATIWVEDTPKHAVAGERAGHQPFLMDQKWNRYYYSDNIKRVETWYDIYSYLYK